MSRKKPQKKSVRLVRAKTQNMIFALWLPRLQCLLSVHNELQPTNKPEMHIASEGKRECIPTKPRSLKTTALQKLQIGLMTRMVREQTKIGYLRLLRKQQLIS